MIYNRSPRILKQYTDSLSPSAPGSAGRVPFYVPAQIGRRPSWENYTPQKPCRSIRILGFADGIGKEGDDVLLRPPPEAGLPLARCGGWHQERATHFFANANSVCLIYCRYGNTYCAVAAVGRSKNKMRYAGCKSGNHSIHTPQNAVHRILRGKQSES